MGGRRRKGRKRRDHPKPNKQTVERPAEPLVQHRWYEDSFIEVVVAIVLFAFATGWAMLGLPQSSVVGIICWGICAALVCHVFWSRTGWRRAYRVSASALVALTFIGLITYALTRTHKPDVTLRLSAAGHYAISAVAHSENGLLAERVRYEFELFNTTAFIQGRPEELQFSRYEQDKGESLRSDSDLKIGPIFLRPNFVESQRYGDKIIGTGIISCPTCVRVHGYWLYLKVGEGGWYAETADGSEPKLIGEKDKTTEQKRDFFIDPETYLNSKKLRSRQPLVE
jgi:hypothetical protein